MKLKIKLKNEIKIKMENEIKMDNWKVLLKN